MQEQCKLKKFLEEEVRLLCGNILDFDREVRKITDVQDGSATCIHVQLQPYPGTTNQVSMAAKCASLHGP